MQLRNTRESPDPVAMTIPGLSMSFTCLSNCTSCRHLETARGVEEGGINVQGVQYLPHFVTPGVAPTLHVLDRLRLLMILLLPTLGRPGVM